MNLPIPRDDRAPDAERLADTIVDAVIAVVDEGVTEEWGLRHRSSGGIWYSTTDEREIRRLLAHGGNRDSWKLVQRRLTEWRGTA